MVDKPDDKELLRVTLRDLSKTVPSNLSSRYTLTTYLRWLEIHRQEETKCTTNWPKTILHWTQALKNRGFSEDELVSKVNIWKNENGPFRSYLRRYPPMPSDISRGFAEKEEGKIDHQGTWGHNSCFDGPPPKGYICNRCGKGGHHLQVCPTNMDPAYDKPPGEDYTCSVCHAKGNHYKSLCPKNLDPYSITQKRKAAGVSPKGAILEQWENERETRPLRGKSVNQGGAIMKRIRDIDNFKHRYERGESVDSDDIALVDVASGKRGREDVAGKGGTTSKRARTGNTWSGNVTIREHRDLDVNFDSIMGGESAEVCESMEVTTEPPMYKYSAFVRNLSARSGGHMSEIINPIKRRPIAVDIWEQDDIDRIMDLVTPDRELDQGLDNSDPASPGSSGAQSPGQNRSGRLTPYGRSASD